jgi:16S rRNA (guanine966-N2)-methyltransferase
MRIIAGKWKGRKLIRPPEKITRPTTDRVREALFSSLTSRIASFADKYVFDAFAGSGALGLEALSRGAEHVLFAEKNASVRHVLQQNIVSLNCLDSVDLISDVFMLGQVKRCYDLIFLDPPYGLCLEIDLIPLLLKYGYVNNSTLIVLETQTEAIPDQIYMLNCIEAKRYGNCALSYWNCSL